MVVAKNDQAHAELSRQFREREVEKEYIALVWGVVQQGRRIDLPIGRDPVQRQKISARSRRTREAVTRVTKAEHLDGVSLLHVAIATGRTHQIRVHLSEIGHPVVEDSIYAGSDATCRRICGPSFDWSGRSCTPHASPSATRGMAAPSSSRVRSRPTCRTSSTSCAP